MSYRLHRLNPLGIKKPPLHFERLDDPLIIKHIQSAFPDKGINIIKWEILENLIDEMPDFKGAQPIHNIIGLQQNRQLNEEILCVLKIPDWHTYNSIIKKHRENQRKEFIKIRNSLTIDKCSKCHSKTNLEVHHVQPLFNGGSNELRNLNILCQRCHLDVHRGCL